MDRKHTREWLLGMTGKRVCPSADWLLTEFEELWSRLDEYEKRIEAMSDAIALTKLALEKMDRELGK